MLRGNGRRPGGSVDGGWDRGGRSADHHGACQMMLLLEGGENNHHLGRMIASNGVRATDKIL